MDENNIMQTENADVSDAEVQENDFLDIDGEENDGEFFIEEADRLPDMDEAAGAAAETGGERMFHLKHLDTEIDADEKKVVELAQKGMDYDRIRGRYEKANAETARLLAERSFIQEIADDKGMTVEQYIDDARAKRRMEKENMGEREARTAARALRSEVAAAADGAVQREKVWYEFCCAYPDVRAEDVPAEVMQSGVKSGDLKSAYEAYLYRQLRKQGEVEEKNSLNRQRSTGSRRNHGAAIKRSEFDSLWYDGT